MHILWIGKQSTSGTAGDEIFDARTIEALRTAGHTVTLRSMERAGRLREWLNLGSGLPHYRTRYASAANRARAARVSLDVDAAICSWEPLDVLLPVLPRPVLLIAHNVSSRSLPSLFPGNPVLALRAMQAARWERRTYRRTRVDVIAALSRADRDHVAGLPNAPPVVLTVPGMPPRLPLAPDAGFVAELAVHGTFDWRPKRRDLVRFARDYRGERDRFAVTGSGWPDEAHALLPPAPPDPLGHRAIRLGLITDRFEAGHKLKTLAYVAENRIVLSFADVSGDFADVPDHEFCIRRISTVGEIAAHVAELSALPAPTVRARFLAFQARCATSFTWDHVAATLANAAERAAGRETGMVLSR